MWVNEVAPERLAELFHHYHQALMPEIAGKGSEKSGKWTEVPASGKEPFSRRCTSRLAGTGFRNRRSGSIAARFCPAGRSGVGLLGRVFKGT